MCGLCGSIGTNDPVRLSSMVAALRHRGPDDEGSASIGAVDLGFRRLSIIDLSSGGHQPWISEGGDIALIFNGEIYNYRELRDQLRADGVEFRSKSDTEVILRLYQRHGISAIGMLHGMFAIALVDHEAERVFLARDRFGIKPLFVAKTPNNLLFASEIKALLACDGVVRSLDDQALADYLTYLYVPAPATMFAGIQQVMPGQVLHFDLRGELLHQTVGAEIERVQFTSPTEAKAALRVALTRSVEHQMVSDVPIGLFLSGGIDSVILAGLMASVSDDPIHTFTVAFEGEGSESFDERALARRAAERVGSQHRELSVAIGDPQDLLEVTATFDQPFGNPTAYLMFLISRAARGEVSVALNGAGGDELFAGYPRYRAVQAAAGWSGIPVGLMRGVGRILGFVPDRLHRTALRRIRGFFDGWTADDIERFVRWTYYLDEPAKSALLQQPPIEREPASRTIRRVMPSGRHALQDFLDADLRTFLVDNVLDYTDRMSMATGLEVRVPYLDERVVAVSRGMPASMKLAGKVSKVALKEVFADLIPEEISGAKKKGFNLPIARWMNGSLGTYFDRNMSPSLVRDRGLFNADEIQRLRSEHRQGRADHSAVLFGLISFDLWDRRSMRGEPLDSRDFL